MKLTYTLAAFAALVVLAVLVLALPASAAPQQQALSSDATLAALTVNDGAVNVPLRPTFDSAITFYRVAVKHGSNQVTIGATTTDPKASVTISDQTGPGLEDADPGTAGFQIAVAVGQHRIYVEVTAEDGSAELYQIVVERDSARPGGWTPTKDVHELDPVDIPRPQGIWSDGTTIWLTNYFTQKIFAYTLATGVRDQTKEFPLHTDNDKPWGIWSDRTTIWVVDSTDRKLYAYTLSGGARDAAKDIDLDSNNQVATGIWSDGTTAWVADFNASKVFAYDLATKAPDATKRFDLPANGLRNTGIWSDGTTVWVGDWEADKLYAYTLSGGARDEGRDIALINAFAGDIWGGGTTIWVADEGFGLVGRPSVTHRIYSYLLPPSSPSDITLSSLEVLPARGMPSFSANLRPAFSFTTVSYRVAVPKYGRRVTVRAPANNRRTLVAYLDARGHVLEDADSGTPGFQVDLAVGETAIDLRLEAGGTAFVYTLIVERDSAERYGWTPTKDFNNLLQNNPGLAGDAIRGVWGNETTMYVMGNTKPKIYAYTRTTGARDESKDIATDQGPAAIGENLATAGGFQASIWSDGTTIWVLNYYFGEDDQGTETKDGSGMVFAYTLSNGVRDTTKEFPLHLATTHAARGIWSDGTTAWVSDYKAAKLFAYALAGGARIPRKDITLNLSNHSAQGIWGDGTTIWVAQWNSSKFYAYTLATGRHDPDRDFDRVPDNHYPREIWSDGKTLFVTEHFGKKLFAYNMVSTTSPATGRPVISGELEVGHTLIVSTSDIRDDNGLTNPGYIYQWQRQNGGVFTDITDATGMLYTLTSDDEGKQIRVKVTFTDDDGSRHMLTSLDTRTVQAQTSIPSDKVEVSLGATAYEVEEGDTIQIPVTLAEAHDEDGRVIIPFTVTLAGGATTADFMAKSSYFRLVRFYAGETTEQIEIMAVDDTLDDDGESLTLCLGDLPEPYAALPGKDCATILIIDNDDPNSVEVAFGSRNYYTSEDGNPAWPRITVYPVPDREITIPITFTRGGGLSAADHSTVTTSVTFGPGLYGEHGDGHLSDNRTYASFPIEIWAIDDSEDDDGEYMDLAFGNLPPFVSQETTNYRGYTESRVWFHDNDFTEVAVTNPSNKLETPTTVTTPGAPASLTATRGDTEVDLRWTPPASDGGAAITKYQYRVSADGGTNWAPDWTDVPDGSDAGSDLDDERTVTATNLTNRTKYTFQVRAVNSEGSGSEIEATATPTTTVRRLWVSFADAELEASEGDFEYGKVATVRVRLGRHRDMEREVEIPINVEWMGGATRADTSTYTSIPSTITFKPGQTEQTFRVAARDDSVDDDGEWLKLSFGKLPERVLTGRTTTTRIDLIDDDDPPVQVSFAQSSYEAAITSRENCCVYARLDVIVKLSAAPERYVNAGIVAESISGGGDIYLAYAAYIPSGPPYVGAQFYADETEFTVTVVMSALGEEFDADQTYRLRFVGMSDRVSVGTPATATITVSGSP